jgi:twitching motility protein PilJ
MKPLQWLKSMVQRKPRTAAGAPPSTPALPRTLPLIGHFSLVRQVQILFALILALIMSTAALIYTHQKNASILASHGIIVEKMEIDLLRIMDHAQLAARGEPGAAGNLQDARARFENLLGILAKGGDFHGTSLPPIRDDLQPVVREMGSQWQPINKNISLVLAQRGSLIRLPAHEKDLRNSVNTLEPLAQRLVVATQDAGEAYATTTFARQLHADVRNFNFVNAMSQLSTDTSNPQVALGLAGNARNYQSTLKALLGEGKAAGFALPIRNKTALEAARALDDAFTPFAASVEFIVANMAALSAAKQAGRDIHQAIGNMIPSINTAKAYDSGLQASDPLLIGAILSALLMLAALGLLVKLYLDDARRRALLSEQENRRNQEAILKLLDDMGKLADGDLTVQAQVTEDITGAIADSVNYTVEQIRGLVSGITKAADQVASATGASQKVATQLLAASQKQSVDIQATGKSVLQIAQSIGQVSVNATQSAQVAQDSLTVAEKGARAVQNAIRGMDEIREQIQETAKRIKRLGESSQEIGEIVQLISGITEQTNVLALNAAIQAASAGEAGRGFAVVAEEVQRLAERSAEATKHISVIVKSIQQDTQSTIDAMERSTLGVVEGAKVADQAGQSLREIEKVTMRLAELIGGISNATQEQARSAEQVAASMKGILNITQITTAGTQKTARSTTDLIALANELKHSVAGFRLA